MPHYNAIIIDGDNVARRIFAVNKSGFRSQIPAFLHNLRVRYTGRLIVAWDSYPPIRRETFKAYKAQRKPMPDDDHAVYRQGIKFLKDTFLPVIGVAQFRADGEEADDVVKTLCRIVKEDTKLVVSNDGDLIPCLDSDVDVLNPWTKQKPRIKGLQRFIKDHGYHPSVLYFKKALVGCKSDGIPGVKGVGDTYAERIIIAEGGLDWSSLWLTDVGGKPPFPDVKLPNGMRSKILESRALVKRNIDLVTLRYIPEKLICKLPKPSVDKFHRFMRIFKLNREMLTDLEEYLEERDRDE